MTERGDSAMRLEKIEYDLARKLGYASAKDDIEYVGNMVIQLRRSELWKPLVEATAAASLSEGEIEELARLLEQRQKLKTEQIAEQIGLAMVHTSLTEQEFAGVLREYLGGMK